MSIRTNDQILHDKINLPRLVKRLEKSVSEEDWSDTSRRDTWMKAQGTLQVCYDFILKPKQPNVVSANPTRAPAFKERRD